MTEVETRGVMADPFDAPQFAVIRLDRRHRRIRPRRGLAASGNRAEVPALGRRFAGRCIGMAGL